MKFVLFLFTVLLFSCNGAEKDVVDNTIVDSVTTPQKLPQSEDSATAKLHVALSAIVTAELKFTSPIRNMVIDSLKYQMISLKEYYQIQRDELARDAHLSTNKEKTNNALAYLDKMISKAPVGPDVYKVQFHLNAQFTNNIFYNEGHTKYLNKDLSEIRIVFP